MLSNFIYQITVFPSKFIIKIYSQSLQIPYHVISQALFYHRVTISSRYLPYYLLDQKKEEKFSLRNKNLQTKVF